MTRKKFVESSQDGDRFAADSAKGVVLEEGGIEGKSRIRGSPPDQIEEMRAIKDTDPHVSEAINTLVDWVCGDGFEIVPRKLGGVEEVGETEEEAIRLRKVFIGSGFWAEMSRWVEAAMTDGTAFLELVVEDETLKPRLLPTDQMVKKADEYGRVQQYGLYPPDTPSRGSSITEMPDEATTYEPHEIAELSFRRRPTDFFGRSFVEAIHEQADMLRDMEIDYARFIATKAYPPIIWKCGTEEEKWTEDQIDGWLETVQEIEPDSMLAAPHDVDHEVVGTTSTMSQAGALRLEETFKHIEDRIVTGLGVPGLLMNMQDGRREIDAIMPDFKRRITKLQNHVKKEIENQIFRSILEQSFQDDFSAVPEFEFGQHSSAEKRLEVDKLLKLYNNGFLTREAFAERAGIDPDTELPSDEELQKVMETIHQLEGKGDNIQNRDGGSPTDTGGGAESSGGEVTSRDDPGAVDEDSRNKKSATEDVDA